MDENTIREIQQWMAKAPYSTGFRYPGDFMEPEQADVDEAIKLAEKAIDLVSGKIPIKFVVPDS